MPKKTKKCQREEKEDLLIERAISCLEHGAAVSKRNEKPNDSDDVFGQFVASELHTVQQITDSKLKQLIKWKIQNALFEGTINATGSSAWIPPQPTPTSYPYSSTPETPMYSAYSPPSFHVGQSGSNTETESVI